MSLSLTPRLAYSLFTFIFVTQSFRVLFIGKVDGIKKRDWVGVGYGKSVMKNEAKKRKKKKTVIIIIIRYDRVE